MLYIAGAWGSQEGPSFQELFGSKTSIGSRIIGGLKQGTFWFDQAVPRMLKEHEVHWSSSVRTGLEHIFMTWARRCVEFGACPSCSSHVVDEATGLMRARLTCANYDPTAHVAVAPSTSEY